MDASMTERSACRLGRSQKNCLLGNGSGGIPNDVDISRYIHRYIHGYPYPRQAWLKTKVTNKAGMAIGAVDAWKTSRAKAPS